MRQASHLPRQAISTFITLPFKKRPIAQAIPIVICGIALYAAQPQLGFAQTQSSQAPQNVRQSYNIPAGALAPALRSLASSANLLLTFTEAQTNGKTTQGLSGVYTSQDAISSLLSGTGLTAVPLQNGGYVLRTAPDGSVSAAEATVLPAVSVRGDINDASTSVYAGGQVARESRLGLLGNTDILDAPFNITSYTAKTVEDQQARNLADLLGRNDPSVRVSGGEGGDTDTLRIRGFDVGMEDSTFNGLPGLLAYYRSSPEFVERVEVLKGPSTMLSGMSPSGTVGGMINVIPKRAADKPLTRFTTSYLSDSRLGLHGDVGRRFGENNEWGVRVNGLVRKGDTARDYQRQNHQVGSVALDYRGQRVRASVDYIYQSMKDHAARTAVSVGAATAGIALPAPSGKTNFSQPWAFVDSGNKALSGRIEFDITSDVTGYAAIGRSKGWFDGKGPGNISVTSVNGDTLGSAAASAFHLDTTSAEVGVGGKFTTGSVKHQWATSITSVDRETSYGFSASAGAVVSNIYSPIYYAEPNGIQPAVANLASKSKLPSIGIADTLIFAEDKVRLTIGVRHQRVKSKNFDTATGAVTSNYDDSAITPFTGLVIKPWNGGAIYANHIEGLAQGQIAPVGSDNAGEILAPYKSKQYEIGVKQDWNGFGGSVSLFQISRPSGMLVASTNRFEASGEQKHQGIEANMFGEVTKGVRLLGGAAWIDAKITNSATAASIGNRPIGVPEFTANLGSEWDVPGMNGLTLSAAAIHTGASYADVSNLTRMPSWTRADLGARWTTRISNHGVTFRAALENAFDKQYWSVGTFRTLQLGMPRTLALSATIDF